MGLKLPDDYKHFDQLIWQVPSWGIAIATGVIVAAQQIGSSCRWGITPNQVQALILGFGAVLLSALSIAVHKYRLFQSACLDKPLPKPPFGQKPSAGRYMQGALLLTNGGLFGLTLTTLFEIRTYIFLGFFLGIVSWLYIEKRLSLWIKQMDSEL
ncbi:MAG: hypothetical protein Q8M34_11005 [Thermodesulfovibrionales bacterium]|nr:hypothetical protein [Thermodesulfovibrionales bacterium]